MRLIVLESGSKGNCSLLISNNKKILIDIGINYLKLKKYLEDYNLEPENIDGIILTHSHSDHILGLGQFIKKNNIKVYVNNKLYKEISKLIDDNNIEIVEEEFSIGDIDISSFNTSHDSVGSVGFIINADNKSLVYVTDTGYLSKKNLDKMINKNIYYFESNHDVKMLMDGPYPYVLKQRVLSDKGHLSNELCGSYLHSLIGLDTKKVILAHLSETNNCPSIAYDTVKELIGEEYDYQLLIASQDENLDLGEI